MTEGIDPPYDGPALRRWREARRLTRRQVEAQLGLRPRSLNLIEAGQRPVSASMLLLTRYYDRHGPLDPLPAAAHQALCHLRGPGDGEGAGEPAPGGAAAL